jgi:hypothetical protein
MEILGQFSAEIDNQAYERFEAKGGVLLSVELGTDAA